MLKTLFSSKDESQSSVFCFFLIKITFKKILDLTKHSSRYVNYFKMMNEIFIDAFKKCWTTKCDRLSINHFVRD